MQITIACVAIVVCLAIVFLFEERPKTQQDHVENVRAIEEDPLVAKMHDDEEDEQNKGLSSMNLKEVALANRVSRKSFAPGDVSMKEQYRRCFTNAPFMFTSIGSSTMIILIFVFTSILELLVSPYGTYSSAFVENLGICLQGVGIVGGVVSSIALTAFPKMLKPANYIVGAGSALGLVYFFFANKAADETQLLISCAVMGFFMLAVFMPAYEVAVEQTEHLGVGESVSCGVINTLGNTFSAILALSLTPLLE